MSVDAIALDLRRTAVSHKREEARHRRLAREAMEQLRRYCAEHGVEFVEVMAKTETEDRHGRAGGAHY